MGGVWVVRVREDDRELRPWHYIYVHSIEIRLIMRVRYGRALCVHARTDGVVYRGTSLIRNSPPPRATIWP